MRQGLLSEPEASSGPAAMLLAVSRSPSSIPRRSPLPGAMPPSSGDPSTTSTSQNLKKTSPTASTPGAMPPSSGVPQPHPPLKTSKTPPTASTPGAMPPSSGIPQPPPPNETSNVSPPTSNAKSRHQKKSLAQA